ncbi:MAG TPA: hypothetical protein VFP95_03980, partial [Gammaproteobacteria bacterium]|nr:hypothetical protein [Gammaproteobacteria bacterium]
LRRNDDILDFGFLSLKRSCTLKKQSLRAFPAFYCTFPGQQCAFAGMTGEAWNAIQNYIKNPVNPAKSC